MTETRFTSFLSDCRSDKSITGWVVLALKQPPSSVWRLARCPVHNTIWLVKRRRNSLSTLEASVPQTREEGAHAQTGAAPACGDGGVFQKKGGEAEAAGTPRTDRLLLWRRACLDHVVTAVMIHDVTVARAHPCVAAGVAVLVPALVWHSASDHDQ